MNIPEEVIREASGEVGDALWSAKPSPHETEVVRLSAPVIAEWARKEALREAAAAIRNNAGCEDENGICEGVSNWPDASARTYSFAAHEAIEAVHALAEGDN